MADPVHSTNPLLRIFRRHAADVITEIALPSDERRKASDLLDRLMLVLDRSAPPEAAAETRPAERSSIPRDNQPSARQAPNQPPANTGDTKAESRFIEFQGQRIEEGPINRIISVYEKSLAGGDFRFRHFPSNLRGVLRGKLNDRRSVNGLKDPDMKFDPDTVVTPSMLLEVATSAELLYAHLLDVRGRGQPDPVLSTREIRDFRRFYNASKTPCPSVAVDAKPSDTEGADKPGAPVGASHAPHEADQKRSLVVGDRIIVEGEINFTLRTRGPDIDAGRLRYGDFDADFVNRLQVRQKKIERATQNNPAQPQPGWEFPPKIRVAVGTIVTRQMLENLLGPTDRAYLQVVEARATGRPDPIIRPSVMRLFQRHDNAGPTVATVTAPVPTAEVQPPEPEVNLSGGAEQVSPSTESKPKKASSKAATPAKPLSIVVGDKVIPEGEINFTLRTRGAAIDAGQLLYRNLDSGFLSRLQARQSTLELSRQRSPENPEPGWRFPSDIRVAAGTVVTRRMLDTLRTPVDRAYVEVAEARDAGQPDPEIAETVTKRLERVKGGPAVPAPVLEPWRDTANPSNRQLFVVVQGRIIPEGEINFTLRTRGAAIDAEQLRYRALNTRLTDRLKARQTYLEVSRQQKFPQDIRMTLDAVVTRRMLENLRGPFDRAYMEVVEARAAGRPEPKIPPEILGRFKRAEGAEAIETPQETDVPEPEKVSAAAPGLAIAEGTVAPAGLGTGVEQQPVPWKAEPVSQPALATRSPAESEQSTLNGGSTSSIAEAPAGRDEGFIQPTSKSASAAKATAPASLPPAAADSGAAKLRPGPMDSDGGGPAAHSNGADHGPATAGTAGLASQASVTSSNPGPPAAAAASASGTLSPTSRPVPAFPVSAQLTNGNGHARPEPAFVTQTYDVPAPPRRVDSSTPVQRKDDQPSLASLPTWSRRTDGTNSKSYTSIFARTEASPLPQRLRPAAPTGPVITGFAARRREAPDLAVTNYLRTEPYFRARLERGSISVDELSQDRDLQQEWQRTRTRINTTASDDEGHTKAPGMRSLVVAMGGNIDAELLSKVDKAIQGVNTQSLAKAATGSTQSPVKGKTRQTPAPP